jgi:hypothetical protein
MKLQKLSNKYLLCIPVAIGFSLLLGYLLYILCFGRTREILPDDQFAFGPLPEVSQSGGIEGMYFSRSAKINELYNEIFCKMDGWDSCEEYQLIRFYTDGAVIFTPLSGDHGLGIQDLDEFKTSFNRNSEDFLKGTYYISGNRIWFNTSVHYEVVDKTITIDFSGYILGKLLILNEYGHATGYQTNWNFFSPVMDESLH